MVSDHYFSNTPASAFTPRTVTVRLADRDVEVTTAGGTFSPDHLDRGTEVLLSETPLPAREGTLLDLGCGWGPIALTLGMWSPEAQIWAVDVNERALQLTRMNVSSLGLLNVHIARPDDVPEDLAFTEIWSNPPIRVGKKELHGMLEQWLPRLVPGGRAHLVVAKKLGADSLLRWLNERFAEVGHAERTANESGFRILTFTRNER